MSHTQAPKRVWIAPADVVIWLFKEWVLVLTTLDDIVQRLVAGYDPDRIILFGSHATGEGREGSDIDLLG